MELADIGKGKAAQWVIVEIPPEEIAARKQLLDLLPAPTRTQVLNAQPDNRGKYRKFNLNVPIHIKVTVFGFFDAHHYSVNWKNSKGRQLPLHASANPPARLKPRDLQRGDNLGAASDLGGAAGRVACYA